MGIMKKTRPTTSCYHSIDIKSVDEYVSRVQQLGSKIVYPKMAIPRTGYFTGRLGIEGNSFGIFLVQQSAK
jgi:predicted enzyme related to lactoylglutathione lyase